MHPNKVCIGLNLSGYWLFKKHQAYHFCPNEICPSQYTIKYFISPIFVYIVKIKNNWKYFSPGSVLMYLSHWMQCHIFSREDKVKTNKNHELEMLLQKMQLFCYCNPSYPPFILASYKHLIPPLAWVPHYPPPPSSMMFTHQTQSRWDHGNVKELELTFSRLVDQANNVGHFPPTSVTLPSVDIFLVYRFHHYPRSGSSWSNHPLSWSFTMHNTTLYYHLKRAHK
jgi:hypothetical protein